MPSVSRIARTSVALSAALVLGGFAVSASAAELSLPGSSGTSALASTLDPSSSGTAAPIAASNSVPLSAPSPSAPTVPSLPGLQDAPQTLLAPTLSTPPAPTLPSARQDQPAGAQTTPKAQSQASAPTAAARFASRDSRAVARRAPSPDAPRSSGAQTGQQGGQRARRGPARDSRRTGDRRTTSARTNGLADPAASGIALSPFDRLGTSPEYPSPSPSLTSFGEESTGGLVWALQLLAVMLLIGLGGFVRIARPL